MKTFFDISKLIIKKKLKFLSQSEKLQLKQFKNKYPFVDNIDFNYIVKNIHQYKEINSNKSWQAISKRIENNSKKSLYQKIQPVFKYAAILIFAMGLFYLVLTRLDIFTFSKQNIPDNLITLKSENGRIQTILLDQEQKIKTSGEGSINVKKNNTLICEKNLKSDKLVYDELNIPHGQKIKIVLSDGTKIHLNSGTTLRFPATFIKGHYRKVYLTGEAYFEVSKDRLHPFIVQSNNLEVKVLGTKFNVSAYKESPIVNTVLVEGSVELFKSNNSQQKALLFPGENASWKKSDSHIVINKVDVNDYIGWINGQLIFKRLSFKDISQKLERAYNVSITNNNAELSTEIFSASFNQNTDKIENILFYLSKTYHFTYIIKNNQVIIN
ncbi:FecR family protein [Flavobacterium sp. LAR06]|uniref:FecR family protein n=1 Tax=Flavobacterium sp. LAR06 TaxID=3064897 RepID=UPI0035C1B61A